MFAFCNYTMLRACAITVGVAYTGRRTVLDRIRKTVFTSVEHAIVVFSAMQAEHPMLIHCSVRCTRRLAAQLLWRFLRYGLCVRTGGQYVDAVCRAAAELLRGYSEESESRLAETHCFPRTMKDPQSRVRHCQLTRRPRCISNTDGTSLTAHGQNDAVGAPRAHTTWRHKRGEFNIARVNRPSPIGVTATVAAYGKSWSSRKRYSNVKSDFLRWHHPDSKSK